MWTREQFQAWRQSPETKEFFGFLNDVRETLKEKWARGQHMSDADHAVAMVYGDILNLTYDGDDGGPGVAAFYGVETEDESEQQDGG